MKFNGFKLGQWNITLTKKGWLAVGIGLVLGLLLLLLAWAIGLLAILISFTLILVNALWAFLVWLAVQLGLVTLFTTIFAFITGTVSTIIGWFASTWLGSFLMPLYSWIMPVVSKFAPFLTAGKWGKRLWAWASNLSKKGEETLPIEHKK